MERVWQNKYRSLFYLAVNLCILMFYDEQLYLSRHSSLITVPDTVQVKMIN